MVRNDVGALVLLLLISVMVISERYLLDRTMAANFFPARFCTETRERSSLQNKRRCRVGYLLSESKEKRIPFHTFKKEYRNSSIDLVKVDVNRSVAAQGPFDVFIHDFTDIVREAEEGDTKAEMFVAELSEYVSRHPNMVVMNPVASWRLLHDRLGAQGVAAEVVKLLNDPDVIVPNRVYLEKSGVKNMMKNLKMAGVTFPFVCKSSSLLLAEHHKMTLVYGRRGLESLDLPCAAESFTNHSGILHKIYVIGDTHFVYARPSLKNFAMSDDLPNVQFSTSDVAKSDSVSPLNAGKRGEPTSQTSPVSDEKISRISDRMRHVLGSSLIGIDVIVQDGTGNHVIIDVNDFPGYHEVGTREFQTALLQLLRTGPCSCIGS
ncbi:inositol-tetrakisphosphate 1-kinase-like isoform X1 [Branchiostoma floridae]|uniref:Inositol-tetrakisphosphate 1-kinase n=1 Tax=Branchiostoma floridae TaxID=7739 RepID=A0A9J7HKT8_BRAFL|nr:inositol-tetrakisphosphate 1-kinase-like isoform X1 [Branchiostoma floridae]